MVGITRTDILMVKESDDELFEQLEQMPPRKVHAVQIIFELITLYPNLIAPSDQGLDKTLDVFWGLLDTLSH